MSVKQMEDTKIVFGLNLINGQNTIRIACTNDEWDFSGCHISPLK